METELREVQLACYDVLKAFKKVCEKKNLRYYLAFGTLLGSIRHSGFIPWDDDIDVWMPRPDMEEFLNSCQEDMKPYVINYFTIDNNASMKYRSQPCIENHEFRRVGFRLGNNVVPGYVWIDIMPLDGMPENENQQKKQNRCFRWWYMILGFARSSVVGAFNPVSKRGLKKFGMKLNEKINIGRFLNIEKCLAKFDEKRKRYSFDNSDYCTGTTTSYTDRALFPKEWFVGNRKHQYEDEEFSIPLETEKILHQLYGDFMKTPPEEMRKGSHFHILNYEEYLNDE